MSEKQSKYTPSTAWKKGQSGNPNGRPKKAVCISDILNTIGDEKDKNGIPKRKKMLQKVYDEAIRGQSWAVNFIADRTEGKAIDRILTEEVKDVIVIE